MSQHAQHKHKHAHKKERGTLLSILLILVIVNGVILTLLSISEKNARDEITDPIIVALFIISAIAHAVAGIALWRWKQWGLYLYLAAAILTGALGLINTGSLVVFFGAVLPFAIVGYVIAQKWRMFD